MSKINWSQETVDTLRDRTEKERIHQLRLKNYGGEKGLKEAEEFGQKIAQAMVDNLNRKVLEENSSKETKKRNM